MTPPLLEASGLTVRIGGATLLHDASATLRAGEVLGIVGPNGAGKSTLLRAMAGLPPAPLSGQVQLAGTPLGRLAPAVLARRRGYLPQGDGIAWPLRLHDLVALGRLPWGGADANGAVASALASMGLEGLAEREVTTLSGGERRRALLARVIAGEPEAILADEPTAGLDPGAALEVMATLRALAHRGGAGVALVVHDLNLALRFCDRLVLVAAGTIAAEGRPSEVLARAAEAFQVQLHLATGPDGKPFAVPLPRGPELSPR
nr:ABC transporter ATP-binding protein [uncultured Roseococcus sp.]